MFYKVICDRRSCRRNDRRRRICHQIRHRSDHQSCRHRNDRRDRQVRPLHRRKNGCRSLRNVRLKNGLKMSRWVCLTFRRSYRRTYRHHRSDCRRTGRRDENRNCLTDGSLSFLMGDRWFRRNFHRALRNRRPYCRRVLLRPSCVAVWTDYAAGNKVPRCAEVLPDREDCACECGEVHPTNSSCDSGGRTYCGRRNTVCICVCPQEQQ